VNTPIWFLISSETQSKFRALASAEFKPPRDEFEHVTLKVKLEDTEELAKEMKKRPRHR